MKLSAKTKRNVRHILSVEDKLKMSCQFKFVIGYSHSGICVYVYHKNSLVREISFADRIQAQHWIKSFQNTHA